MHETLAPNDYGEGDVSLRSYKCEADPTLAALPLQKANELLYASLLKFWPSADEIMSSTVSGKIHFSNARTRNEDWSEPSRRHPNDTDFNCGPPRSETKRSVQSTKRSRLALLVANQDVAIQRATKANRRRKNRCLLADDLFSSKIWTCSCFAWGW